MIKNSKQDIAKTFLQTCPAYQLCGSTQH